MWVDNRTLVVVAALALVGVAVGATAGPGAPVADQQVQQNETASIQFANQTSNGSAVAVERVTLPDGGYVAVYNGSGALLGSSDYLENGTSANVTVGFAREATADGSTTLIAIAHRDTNANRIFDFLTVEGTTDSPYTTLNGIVLEVASVDVEAAPPAEETPTEETPAEETPGEETPAEETPGEETPAEETPAEETPGEETPAEETPGEETPAEETPAEETPGEETPAEGTPGAGEEEPTPTETPGA